MVEFLLFPVSFSAMEDIDLKVQEQKLNFLFTHASRPHKGRSEGRRARALATSEGSDWRGVERHPLSKTLVCLWNLEKDAHFPTPTESK